MERATRKTVELLEGAVTLNLLVNERSGHVAYVVWPSTYHVAAFLAVLALEPQSLAVSLEDAGALARAAQRLLSQDSKTRRQLFSEARRREVLRSVDVLELGSGTGVLGLGLHALGARVVMTDQAKCFELLAENVRMSRVRPASSREAGTLRCMPLDWKEWSTSSLQNFGDDTFSSPTDGNDVDDAADAAGTQPAETHLTAVQRRCQLLVACDCVYDTSHIGHSPLIPIIRSFIYKRMCEDPAVAAAVAAGGDRKGSGSRFALIGIETRDSDIESDFEYQLATAGLKVLVAFEAPCPCPSEGNDTPPEEAKYRILVVTEKAADEVEAMGVGARMAPVEVGPTDSS